MNAAPSPDSMLSAELIAIGQRTPPLTADGAMLATVDAISTTLGPLLDEIVQNEAAAMATDMHWAHSEGLYLCAIIGGHSKVLSRIASAARLTSTDPEAAWHVLAAAALAARQLVGMIVSPEVADAENRAAAGFAAQTDLHCAAASAGFTLPLPDPDLGRLLAAHAGTQPLAETDGMAAALTAIAAGARAADLSLPAGYLHPRSAAGRGADAPDHADDTSVFQCHLASELLRECTAVAFGAIDGLCLSTEWTTHAQIIATAASFTAKGLRR